MISLYEMLEPLHWMLEGFYCCGIAIVIRELVFDLPALLKGED